MENNDIIAQFNALIHEIRAENENSKEIAVLKAEFRGQREQSKAHAESLDKKIDESMKEVKFEIHGMNKKIDEINKAMNRGRGAFAAAMAMASVIGAGILAATQYLTKQ